MTPLQRIIGQEISVGGPMTLGRYMGLCLSHPEHGYYMTRDPLGAQGDFTTAPEVSQLFGEMIGAWLADTWMRLSAPKKILLVEGGPGRGTLMSDVMRATKRVSGFHDAAQIHLIETSPVLKEKQRTALSHYAVQWHDSLESLPGDTPILFVANELLDALPVEQMQWDGAGWMQRAVVLDSNDALRIGLKPPEPALLSLCDGLNKTPGMGDIFEVSPAIDHFCHELALRMKKQVGAGIFIDYGYEKTAFGDTLQAVQAHQPVSIFYEPGLSDLTAHVNFARVSAQIKSMGLHATNIVTQGAFLKALGIEMRLNALLARATDQQADDLRSGYERLTRPEQMGALFKVVGVSSEPIQLSGF